MHYTVHIHHTVWKAPYSAKDDVLTSGSVKQVLATYILVFWIGLILGYVVRKASNNNYGLCSELVV